MGRQMIKERSNNWTVAYLIHTEINILFGEDI